MDREKKYTAQVCLQSINWGYRVDQYSPPPLGTSAKSTMTRDTHQQRVCCVDHEKQLGIIDWWDNRDTTLVGDYFFIVVVVDDRQLVLILISLGGNDRLR